MLANAFLQVERNETWLQTRHGGRLKFPKLGSVHRRL